MPLQWGRVIEHLFYCIIAEKAKRIKGEPFTIVKGCWLSRRVGEGTAERLPLKPRGQGVASRVGKCTLTDALRGVPAEVFAQAGRFSRAPGSASIGRKSLGGA